MTEDLKTIGDALVAILAHKPTYEFFEVWISRSTFQKAEDALAAVERLKQLLEPPLKKLANKAYLYGAILNEPTEVCASNAATGEPQAGMPLRAEVKADHLCLGIGISTLAWAFEHDGNNNPYNESTRDFEQRYRISDPLQFAKDVCHEMNDEAEDGSTPLTRFLDSMMDKAIERGSLGIHDPDDGANPVQPSDPPKRPRCKGTCEGSPLPEDSATPVPVSEGTWILKYDDPDRPDEVFVGEGAFQSAQKRYTEVKGSWTVTLFRSTSGTGDCDSKTALRELYRLLKHLEKQSPSLVILTYGHDLRIRQVLSAPCSGVETQQPSGECGCDTLLHNKRQECDRLRAEFENAKIQRAVAAEAVVTQTNALHVALEKWFNGDPEMRFAEVMVGENLRWCVRLKQISFDEPHEVTAANAEAGTFEEAAQKALEQAK